jgi:hypothetical protein
METADSALREEMRMDKRTPVTDMTDRELLEELVVNGRALADALEALAQNPMIAAIANGTNPMAALMGRG